MFYNSIDKYGKFCKDLADSDVYNTKYYCALERERLGGEFVFYYHSCEQYEVIIPLLARQIEFSNNCRDLTMGYGYPSPVIIAKEGFDLSCMLTQFGNEAKDEGYVSAFLRIHPILVDLDKLGWGEDSRLRRIGSTVVIDLTLSEEQRLGDFRKVHRRDIKKATSLGINIEIRPFAACHVELIYNIYSSTMERLGAGEQYYFSEKYFESLADGFGEIYWIASAKYESELICCSLFSCCGAVMQYHLSGSSSSSMRGYANKKIISEAANLGSDIGCKFLNLGGGLGAEEDSLFAFKSGFSSIVKPVYVAQIICDDAKYHALINENESGSLEDTYFPKYRS